MPTKPGVLGTPYRGDTLPDDDLLCLRTTCVVAEWGAIAVDWNRHPLARHNESIGIDGIEWPQATTTHDDITLTTENVTYMDKNDLLWRTPRYGGLLHSQSNDVARGDGDGEFNCPLQCESANEYATHEELSFIASRLSSISSVCRTVAPHTFKDVVTNAERSRQDEASSLGYNIYTDGNICDARPGWTLVVIAAMQA